MTTVPKVLGVVPFKNFPKYNPVTAKGLVAHPTDDKVMSQKN
jgi:hypothetical protein